MQFPARRAVDPDLGIRYTVGVDGISLFMVLLTTFAVPLSVLGSYSYITNARARVLRADARAHDGDDRVFVRSICSCST